MGSHDEISLKSLLTPVPQVMYSQKRLKTTQDIENKPGEWRRGMTSGMVEMEITTIEESGGAGGTAPTPIACSPNCVVANNDDKVSGMAKTSKPDPRLAFDGIGRRSKGLYPEVSRVRIAEETGLDRSTIAGILVGRTAAKLEVALVIARAAGVSMEQLQADLAKEREKYKQRQRQRNKR